MRFLITQFRDLAQSLFAHCRHVDARGERVQRFVCANVGRRLFAANVLLTRLEGQHKAASSLGVGRLSDESSRHTTQIFFFAREHAEIRTAETERVAERLPFANHNVGVVRAGRLIHAERNRIRADDEQRARRVHAFRDRFHVAHVAEKIGIGDENARRLLVEMFVENGVERH